MSDVLVTGGLGFIGSHLVERLFAAGHRVHVIDNFDETLYDSQVKLDRAERYSEQYPDQYLPWYVDIRADGYWDRLRLEGYKPDAIIHLAAIAGVRPSLENPGKYSDVNVGGTIRMLDWAVKAGCPRVIYASSSSVYGMLDPPYYENMDLTRIISPYALSKRQGELACEYYSRERGLKTYAVRFFTVYGPRQRPDMFIHAAMRKILTGEVITLFGDGSTYRDYTYVDDIIDGVMLMLDDETDEQHQVFNLGYGQPTTLLGLVSHLEDALNTKANVEHSGMVQGDVTGTLAEIGHAQRVLGYSPCTPVSEGIPRMTKWLRSQL